MGINRRKFASAMGKTLALLPLVGRGSEVGGSGSPVVIDCQSHLFVPEIVSLMKKRKQDPIVYKKGEESFVQMGPWSRRIMPRHMDVDAKIAAMDASGITLTALSINDPEPEWFGKEGAAVARIANDFIAAAMKRYPKRLLGLCVLPL